MTTAARSITHASSYANGVLTIAIEAPCQTLADAGALEGRILMAMYEKTPISTPVKAQAELPKAVAKVIKRTQRKMGMWTAHGKNIPQAHNARWENDDDDLFLIENYGKMPTLALAKKLGRTGGSVGARVQSLREKGWDIPPLRPALPGKGKTEGSGRKKGTLNKASHPFEGTLINPS